MKAVILAAGIGKRLAPYTQEIPKCLLNVNGKEIIEFQLNALKLHKISDIYVVTGHLSDKVEGSVGNRAKCIYNPFYQEGILLSFKTAMEHLYSHEFIYIAGDVVFHPGVLGRIMETTGDVVLGVENKECDEEDSKALIKNNEIIKTGKRLENPDADSHISELVHIIKFSGKGSRSFFDIIEEILGKQDRNAYMMDALNRMREKGLKLIPAYVKNLPRTEIDFKNDLDEANSRKWH
ncbi:MAG: NTP transferase domain-containing protein [Nanoarchaeota archaeon]|nr:NTP transferase domain-containing protein [Nanoarchaeota archaeon]